MKAAIKNNKIVSGLAVLALALGAWALPTATAGRPRATAVARLADASGNVVGVVRLLPRRRGAVEVRTSLRGIAAGGNFHGFHVHSVGRCDPTSKDAAGNTVPFLSAGGHFNPRGADHGAHAGDLPVLLVLKNGSASSSVVTDRFRIRELFDADGSAIVLHAARDNYAHVPPTTPAGGERYHSHAEGVFGPDSATNETGDAGARLACGVVSSTRG